MTETDNNKNNRDTTPSDPSPNHRSKKKNRDTPPDESRNEMDLELGSHVPKQLFNDKPTHNEPITPDSLINNVIDNSTPPNRESASLIDLTGNKNDGRTEDDEEEMDTSNDLEPPSPFLTKLTLADYPIWHDSIKEMNNALLSRYNWDDEEAYTTVEMIKGSGNDPSTYFDALLLLGGSYATDEWDGASTLNTADWIRIFAHVFEAQDVLNPDISKLQRFAIRLALTDPVALFPTQSWTSGQLNDSYGGHYAWIAAYHIFGAIWKDRDEWTPSETTKQSESTIASNPPPLPEKPKRTSVLRRHKNPPSDLPAGSKVGFDSSTKSTKTTPAITTAAGTVDADNATTDPSNAIDTPQVTNPYTKSKKPSMYLSKALDANPYRTAKLKRLKDVGRKFRTFVKIKFAKITAEKVEDQEQEVSSCFQSIMERIWTIDPQAMLLPWKEETRTVQPLKRNSEFPKTKDTLSNYLDRLWLSRFQNPYCRVYVTHDQVATFLFDDNELQQWLEDTQLSLDIERVQARRVCCAGHLLGYHTSVANSNNLADAIEMQPLMRDISVEIRAEYIKLDAKKGNKGKASAKPDKDGKERTNVKIVRIYVSYDKAARARRSLIEIYSSKANGLFPLGVMARFIPDTTDTRFIRTPSAVLAHRNSLLKHIKFMQSTKVASTQNIIELDHRNPRLRMTLRQAIMHIFSPTQRNSNLFVAVDLSYYGDSVLFAFRSELEEEAMNMISALPLFLEATTGHQAVWNWFTRDARLEASYYTWDMQRGVIPNAQMDTDTQLENWEDLDDIDDEGIDDSPTIIQPFQLDLTKIGMNSYNDDGTLATAAYADVPMDLDTDDDDNSSSSSNKKPPSKATIPTMPDIVSIETTTTTSHTTSTLTRTPDRFAALAELANDPAVTSDPAMAELFASLQLRLQAKSGAFSPSAEDGAASE